MRGCGLLHTHPLCSQTWLVAFNVTIAPRSDANPTDLVDGHTSKREASASCFITRAPFVPSKPAPSLLPPPLLPYTFCQLGRTPHTFFRLGRTHHAFCRLGRTHYAFCRLWHAPHVPDGHARSKG